MHGKFTINMQGRYKVSNRGPHLAIGRLELTLRVHLILAADEGLIDES
jgi:hypothetical protein